MDSNNQGNQGNRQPLPVDSQDKPRPPVLRGEVLTGKITWAEAARMLTILRGSKTTYSIRLHQPGDTLPEPDITVKWEDIDA